MPNLQQAIVSELLTHLKRQPRAEGRGISDYIDTGNNLQQIQLFRHSVVFGRRGSGKTTLLAKLREHAETSKYGVIWIDVDDYKTLTFPDVLIQILRSLFLHIQHDVLRNTNFRHPIKRFCSRRVRERLDGELAILSNWLHRFEESEMAIQEKYASKMTTRKESHLGSSIGSDIGVKSGQSDSQDTEMSAGRSETSAGRDRKIDRIRRHLQDAKSLLQDCRKYSFEKYFLILDDFYHLIIDDQARVLDYLQSLAKNNSIYIKFGTIAHRSSLYHRGATLIEGMQKEHDVLSIDLDRTFQNFQEVEEFIKRFWQQIKKEVSGSDDMDAIFGGDSWRQLILATGGVPRDFMNILARSIELGQSKKKEKLEVLLVNEAANLYLRETKHPDLVSDKITETNELEGMLADMRDFCVKEKKRNLFLINKDDLDRHSHQRELLRQLLDFRFIHLVHSNTSAAGHAGRFEAYMLDVGLYAYPQRRGENHVKQVDFLAREDQHRQDAIRTQPIYRLKEDYGQEVADVFAEPVVDEQGLADAEVVGVAEAGSDRDELGNLYLKF